MTAEYRMKEWFSRSPSTMIYQYLFNKPMNMPFLSFYWYNLFGFQQSWMTVIRRIEFVIYAVSALFLMIKKKYIAPTLFLLFTYWAFIYIIGFSFSADRYAETLMSFRYIVSWIGIYSMINSIRNRNKSTKKVMMIDYD